MKVDARHLLFTDPFPWPTYRRLRFTRKGNSVQLLETAMLIEGYVQQLSLPVVDRFFRDALSAWTTVTVPYSRITEYKYNSMQLIRWLITLLLWSPLVFILVGVATDARGPDVVAGVFLAVAYSLIALVFSVYVHLQICAPRNHLRFRQADGQVALVLFRIRSRKLQKAFEETITAYRLSSKQRVAPVAAVEDAPTVWPIVLLITAIIGQQVVPTLWRGFSTMGFAYLRVGVLELANLMITVAPFLLLAAMALAPRNLVVRYLTVGALLVRALLLWVIVLLGFPLPRDLQVSGGSTPWLLENLATTVFYLGLAITLMVVLQKQPAKQEEKA